jgi:spermidine synthase
VHHARRFAPCPAHVGAGFIPAREPDPAGINPAATTRHAEAGSPGGVSVLVGGLGAGHTLRAVLDLEGVERVEVAEIGAKVVEWNRLYFGKVNGRAVDDPRVTIHVDDVLDVIRGASGRFDLVLLDVDNGPEWLASPANAKLYDGAGLTDCARCLRPGGVLALWTPQRIAAVESVLNAVFDDVRCEDTTRIARAADEPPSMIYLAVKAM